MDEEKRLWTEGDVAKRLQLEAKTLKAWRSRGLGEGPPFITISNRCVRYDPDDVRAWEKSKTKNVGNI